MPIQMGETVDEAIVKRVLEEMRSRGLEVFPLHEENIMNQATLPFGRDAETMEAVARNLSLFHAVSLRRAELLRELGPQRCAGGKAGR